MHPRVTRAAGKPWGKIPHLSLHVKIKVAFELPRLELDDKVLGKALNSAGGKLATKTRRALKAGGDYDGQQLPGNDQGGDPIDLQGETGTLIRSVKYQRRLKEVGAFGPHPTASARAGSSYGLMQILMSGKDRNGERTRAPFDLFGARRQVLDDATSLFEAALPDDVLK
jgi:hypothetical protein